MKKCKNCGSKDAKYIHQDGGYVCDKCVGNYFTCPDCGTLFDMDDHENGDQGNGFCKKCASKH